MYPITKGRSTGHASETTGYPLPISRRPREATLQFSDSSIWDGAASAKLSRGAYHFFTLCTAGAVQAQQFLRRVPDDPGALPPAVDLELAGNCSKRPSIQAVRGEVALFIDIVEMEVQERVPVYVGGDFEERYQVKTT